MPTRIHLNLNPSCSTDSGTASRKQEVRPLNGPVDVSEFNENFSLSSFTSEL